MRRNNEKYDAWFSRREVSAIKLQGKVDLCLRLSLFLVDGGFIESGVQFCV